MHNIFEYCITMPLGYIIEFIYNLIPNYGAAIIIFTFVIKMILMPLQVRSQRSMKKTQKVQPILAELQKKYANDQQKLQAETMKLYKENDISMTGGCLPLLIQMPILIGLYQVIQRPIAFLLHVDTTAEETLNKVTMLRDTIAANYPNLISSFAETDPATILKTGQIQVSKWAAVVNGANDPWAVNFNFLGMDLSCTPMQGISQFMNGGFQNFSYAALIFIPIVAVLLTILQTKISQKQSGQTTDSDNPAASTSKGMLMMMPIMTGFFTLTFASGLGLYWIASSLVQILQQVLLNIYFDKKEDDFVVKVPEKRNNQKGKKRK